MLKNKTFDFNKPKVVANSKYKRNKGYYLVCGRPNNRAPKCKNRARNDDPVKANLF